MSSNAPKANETQVGGLHYRSTIQHWDYVLANELDYFQGQITKYVTRWRSKGGIQDLRKAGHFLDKYIEAVEAGFVPMQQMSLVGNLMESACKRAVHWEAKCDDLEEQLAMLITSMPRSDAVVVTLDDSNSTREQRDLLLAGIKSGKVAEVSLAAATAPQEPLAPAKATTTEAAPLQPVVPLPAQPDLGLAVGNAAQLGGPTHTSGFLQEVLDGVKTASDTDAWGNKAVPEGFEVEPTPDNLGWRWRSISKGRAAAGPWFDNTDGKPHATRDDAINRVKELYPR